MPSEKELKSRAEHDKWLMKMGARPVREVKLDLTGINKIPDYKAHKALQVVVII